HKAWRKRSLVDKSDIYLWADGVHFNGRLEDDRLACLTVIGVRPDGVKEVVALEDGYRESTESWKTLLRDLKRRGMPPPKLAIADGALGFWAALREVYLQSEGQRCWYTKSPALHQWRSRLPSSQTGNPETQCQVQTPWKALS